MPNSDYATRGPIMCDRAAGKSNDDNIMHPTSFSVKRTSQPTEGALGLAALL